MDQPNENVDTSMLLDESYIQRIQTKYAQERLRRLHPDGNNQYSELEKAYHSLDEDLCDNEEYKYESDPLCGIEQQRVVIIGAGFGGLLNAVRLLQTGDFAAKDILFLDAASGFGGTWCWNEYPGLMCDIESYIYLPLLEETGYMPSHKYVSGVEVRDHAYRIARMFDLYHRALFCASD